MTFLFYCDGNDSDSTDREVELALCTDSAQNKSSPLGTSFNELSLVETGVNSRGCMP